MNTLCLPRNLQFLYEESLARLEAKALGCERWERDEDNPWQVRTHVNGNSVDMLHRAAYTATLDGEPAVYGELIRPKYQGGVFNRTRSENQYLTHWFYPYRGKFHPQMVRALFNIVGVEPGDTVCEPYVGSGTGALEASLLGINCIAVDISPLCVLLTRVKTRSIEALAGIRERVRELLACQTLDPYDRSIAEHPNEVVADFLEIARLITLSDVSRRRRDGCSWLRKNLEGMLESVEAQAVALDRFRIRRGDVSARRGDARNLRAVGIADATIDGIVTSPPYSIALDYVKNDEHALEALEVDTSALREEMTGVRGRGAKAKLALYGEDMQQMFREAARVLKPGAKAAFVIGDATVDGREHTSTREMGDWAVRAGLQREREIPKIVFGLYSTMRDEKILVFRKPD